MWEWLENVRTSLRGDPSWWSVNTDDDAERQQTQVASSILTLAWWNTSRNQPRRNITGRRPRRTHTLWKQIVQIDKRRGWDIPALGTSGLFSECKAWSGTHPGPRCSQSALRAQSYIHLWSREKKISLSLSRSHRKTLKGQKGGRAARLQLMSRLEELFERQRQFFEERWPRTFKMFHLWWGNGGKNEIRYSFPRKPCSESKWVEPQLNFLQTSSSRSGLERDCGSYRWW